VAVDPLPGGLGSSLDLSSPSSGKVEEVLATFGESFTNNGLAISPDGQDVFFTLIPRGKHQSQLLIERISIADGKRTFVADGEEPAVSPNSRLLAYATGGRSATDIVVVRDLNSGRTRSINIASLIGPHADLFNSACGVRWLANGSDIAVVPGPAAFALAQSSGPRRVAAPSRRLIIVHVPRSPRPLTARSFDLAGVSGDIQTDSADAGDSTSLLLAVDQRNQAAIDRITPTGNTVSIDRLVSIPTGLVLAFDSAGDRLLYLTSPVPPPNTDVTVVTLWSGTLTRNGLIHRHRLVRNSQLAAAAW
jgi:hypothetical protein